MMFFFFLVVMVICLVFHELGHLIILKIATGINHTFELKGFKIDYDVNLLTKGEEKLMFWTAIIGGALPLGLLWIDPLYFAAGCLLYCVGLEHDIKTLWGLYK